MKNLFLSQTGFSLVQGMIVASVIAGSGLVANRMLTDQKLAQRSAETRDNIEDLHNVVNSVMQSRENCSATFADPTLKAALMASTSSAPVTVPAIRTKDGIAYQIYDNSNPANTTYMNNNVIIKDMKVGYTAASGKASLKITYERQVQSDASNSNKKTKSGYGAKTITKEMDMRVQRNPYSGMAFDNCYTVASNKGMDGNFEGTQDTNKDFCNDLVNPGSPPVVGIPVRAFTWDEATSTCKLSSKCPNNMIFTGFRSTGDMICQELTDMMDPNSMIAAPTGNCGPGKKIYFKASSDAKKVSIVCE